MTKTTKAPQLQDLFLTGARRDHVPLTVFLVNGFQLRGTIAGFDSFTVTLDSDGRQSLIYQHAISTITPLRPVPMAEEMDD